MAKTPKTDAPKEPVTESPAELLKIAAGTDSLIEALTGSDPKSVVNVGNGLTITNY